MQQHRLSFTLASHLKEPEMTSTFFFQPAYLLCLSSEHTLTLTAFLGQTIALNEKSAWGWPHISRTKDAVSSQQRCRARTSLSTHSFKTLLPLKAEKTLRVSDEFLSPHFQRPNVHSKQNIKQLNGSLSI